MPPSPARLLPLLALLAGARAMPAVDRSQLGFDEAAYDQAVEKCVGGAAWSGTLVVAKDTVVGAFIGLSAGVMTGQAGPHGDWRIVAGTTAAGALVGLYHGASAAYEERMAEIGDCLQAKGFRLREPAPSTRRESARKSLGNAWSNR